jgi:hypothetical protein
LKGKPWKKLCGFIKDKSIRLLTNLIYVNVLT